MDQYTRRIIGFGINAGIVDGMALCRMFNRAIRRQAVPKYLSSDHDPLYRFHASLESLERDGCQDHLPPLPSVSKVRALPRARGGSWGFTLMKTDRAIL